MHGVPRGFASFDCHSAVGLSAWSDEIDPNGAGLLVYLKEKPVAPLTYTVIALKSALEVGY